MSYDISWHPRVRKFLKKLQPETAKRIVKKIRGIANDPFRYLEHYAGKSYFKLRIGSYRALIDVDKVILKIMVLDKRSRVYK